MGHPSASHQDSFFDGLLSTITQSPRHFFLFILVVGGFFFSVPTVILGLFIALVIRWISIPLWLIAVVGCLLVLGAWWWDEVSVMLVYRLNDVFINALWNGNARILLHIYLWLSAFSYSLLWASAFTYLIRFRWSLQAEMQRVASGRLPKAQKMLSPRQLHRQLKSLNQFETSDCVEGCVLGVDRVSGKPVILQDRDANLHTLAVGTTGSGKTTGIANIIESAVKRHWPLIYVDGKGDLALAKRVEQFAQDQQVPFYRFSMLGESVQYNPLASGGFTSKKDRIIELRHWSEDHYRKLAEGYLQTVLKILDRLQIPIDLYSLAQHMEAGALSLKVRELNNEALSQQVASLSSKREEIESLIAEIQNLTQSEIGHLFDCQKENVLTLQKALTEKAVVYFCLQPLAFPAYAELLGKLIINDIKSSAASFLTKTNPTPLFTIFDEFSLFAGDQIVNLINQGRSAGIHAVLSTQSLSDITRKGGESLLGQILNNTNNYIIQRQNNHGDAEILANMIGTQAGFEVTSQITLHAGATGSGTVRSIHEYIIHPDEIKRLQLGEAVFVNKREFRVQRIQLRKGIL